MNKKNYMSPNTEIVYLRAKHCLLGISAENSMNVNAKNASSIDDGSDFD